MPGRGIFIALTAEEDCVFRELRSRAALAAFFSIVSERVRARWCCHVDKVWDPIHRCLTDGHLHYGRAPLYRCVLGTKNYFGAYSARFLHFLKPEEVQRVSAALARVDQEFLRRNYAKIDQADYLWEKGEEDFGFVWDFFKRLRQFYRRAAGERRAVLFECDQY
jgi:hypothetical protein